MADEDGSELAVLVCSANVGNKEPTPASFAEWIPDDGEIEGPLARTKYPVEFDGAEEVRTSLLRNGAPAKKKFDIIVIGMQEAAFVEKIKNRHSSSGGGADLEDTAGNNGGGVDVSERSNPPPHANEILGTIENGIADATKETKKGKNKMLKKLVKANMIVRGLTTSQTYKAPTLRHHDKNAHNKVKENFAVKSGSYDTRKFNELIENRCPSYKIVTSKLRGEMRLIVLALNDLAEEISNIYIAGENTGIGSVLANKGGIIATFDMRGTRLSFMTCHLEAHEGNAHYMNRNKNLAEIFAGAKTDPNHQMHDATIISHHMFVCGDLNYRIKFGEEAAKKKKLRFTSNLLTGSSYTSRKDKASPSPKSSPPPVVDEPTDVDERKSATNPANGTHYALATSLVEAEDWKTLNDGDELAMALNKKECLAGFKTLPCNFPPTFKVARGEGYQYNEKRTPSYTDRILWKSADGMVDNVVPFLYEPCPDFITSDHKPIRGGYVVKTNRGKHYKSPNIQHSKLGKSANNERQVQLLVSDIKCTNLPIMDSGVLGGLSDPYILFMSDPKPLLWKKAWPVTKVIYRNLNPEWVEDIHLILDESVDAKGTISLNGHMLYMTVMDEDTASGDDLIGTVALNLKELCSGLDLQVQDLGSTSTGQTKNIQTTTISRPVLRNGQEFGMLQCTISAGCLAPGKDTKDFLKIAKKVRSKRKKKSLTNKISKLLHF